jgi:3-hydroxyacyl-CoA dehydrogenase
MTVHFELSDRVALVTIDNPPVNAINKDVRQGLLDAMNRAVASDAERVIITGSGRVFVAGADAKEFDTPPQEPHLNDVLRKLSAFPIPVIAAINGVALGGGLEIALASRYRIAAPSVTLGLPEVTLGIVPGAGGTQRLPRLIGVSKAIELIGTGKAIGAKEATAIGLIDEVSDNPVEAARRVDVGRLLQALSVDLLPPLIVDEAAVTSVSAQIARRSTGQIAPQRAIELIVSSANLNIADGLAQERATFLELRSSDQARALRHVFFAERSALSQGNEFPKPASEIRTAIVVGGGNMGASIAYAFAASGISVTVIETSDDASTRAEGNVKRIVDQGISRKIFTEQAALDVAARIAFRFGYDDLEPVDLAIEAAFEDMEVKRTILTSLAEALPETTILATNTSYLDVNTLAEGIHSPGRFLGLHFFSPAHIMKLLEIVRSDKTSPETLGAAFALAKSLKKVPVISGVCDGFIGNRILSRYRQAADILLLEGATPSSIDAAMRSFGMAMGPYEAQDMSGLDIAYANRKRQNLRARSDVRYVPIVDRLVEEENRLGRKSGAGWYDYEGDRASPSPVVDAQLVRASQEANIGRVDISEKDIQDRILLAMISEATAILEEGIAQRPRDIDLVLVHGYGFPRWRGGLMHYADTLGISEIAESVAELTAFDPISWPVPKLLSKLAATGQLFKSLDTARAA